MRTGERTHARPSARPGTPSSSPRPPTRRSSELRPSLRRPPRDRRPFEQRQPGGRELDQALRHGGPTDCDATGAQRLPDRPGPATPHTGPTSSTRTPSSGTTEGPLRTWTIGVSAAVGPVRARLHRLHGTDRRLEPERRRRLGRLRRHDEPVPPGPHRDQPPTPVNYATELRRTDRPVFLEQEHDRHRGGATSYSFDYPAAVAAGKPSTCRNDVDPMATTPSSRRRPRSSPGRSRPS